MPRMNPERWYKLSGYLSLVFGLAASLSVYKISLLYYGIPIAFFGFVCSGVNIFLQTKYEFEPGKFAKGYLGMFLSSLPLIFLMVMIFKFKPS
jgi:hypothetical protein